MSVSDIVSIVSAAIALLALVLSWRANRGSVKTASKANDLTEKQVALQEQLTKIEQSREHAKLMQSLKANLRAELRQTNSKSWRLFVINTGQGAARNLTITLDGKPLLGHEAIPSGEQEVTTIGPESEISYCMAVTFDCHPPFKFEATWDDDSGQQGKYHTTLTL